VPLTRNDAESWERGACWVGVGSASCAAKVRARTSRGGEGLAVAHWAERGRLSGHRIQGGKSGHCAAVATRGSDRFLLVLLWLLIVYFLGQPGVLSDGEFD
jgi:hypothetical protein